MSFFGQAQHNAKDGPLAEWIAVDTDFIMFNAEQITDEYRTKLGVAKMTHLTVARIDKPDEQFTVSMLGDHIYEAVADTSDDDFPAVVQWTKVDTNSGNKANVLRLQRPYDTTAQKGKRTPAKK